VAYHREGPTVADFVVTRRLDVSFAVRVNRVLLNASVFDRDGAFLTGLSRDDFTVTEEGRRCQIIDFAPEKRPILMGLLLDVSGSMQEEMDDVHTAAGGFVDTLRDVDRAMLVEFSEKVYLLSELTADRAALKSLIGTTKALGGTALFDALRATIRRLDGFDARKALIVLSDGDDTSSATAYKELLDAVKTTDATIYAIALGSGFADVEGRGKLKELTEQTGGRLFHASKASDLAEVYGRVADELRNQYALTYASENERFDGRWIPIQIAVSRKGAEVRTRQGYFAAPPKGL
jgi:Ca-activated chloride channel family protein